MATTIPALLQCSKLCVLLLFLLLVCGESLYATTPSKEVYNFIEKDTILKQKNSIPNSPFSPQLFSISYRYSRDNDNRASISEFNTGFDIKFRDDNLGGRGQNLVRPIIGLQYLSLGLTYKQYKSAEKKDVIGFNANLFKFQIQFTDTSHTKGLVIGTELSLIEKKSPIYANTDIDWVSVNIGLGYDPFYSSESTRIAIIPCLGLGFRNLSLDTNIFTVLPEDKKEKMHYSFVNASARFLASYKSLNLYTDFSIHPFNSLVLLNYKAGISFNLWRTIKEFDVSDCNLFLNFESSNFSLPGSDKGNYEKTIQFIRGGISLRLAGIFDT